MQRQQLGDKTWFITSGGQYCIKLTHDCQDIEGLKSKQYEKATQLWSVLQMMNDLLVWLGLRTSINRKLFMRWGTKNLVRRVDVSKLVKALGADVCMHCGRLHPCTGHDTASALARQGKMKAMKILLLDQKFKKAFSSPGTNWKLPGEGFNTIYEFSCQMCCSNTKVDKVNDLGDKCSMVEEGMWNLGSCHHVKTLSCSTQFKQIISLPCWGGVSNSPDIPDPTEGHGWFINEEGSLIKWMTGYLAPEVVLGPISLWCAQACPQTVRVFWTLWNPQQPASRWPAQTWMMIMIVGVRAKFLRGRLQIYPNDGYIARMYTFLSTLSRLI